MFVKVDGFGAALTHKGSSVPRRGSVRKRRLSHRKEFDSPRLGVPPARFPDRDSWYAAAADGIRRAQVFTFGIKSETDMRGSITGAGVGDDSLARGAIERIISARRATPRERRQYEKIE